MIVSVALRHEGMIFSKPAPARHHDVIHDLAKRGVAVESAEQGFLTSGGTFLTRWQALRAAKLFEQPLKRDEPGYSGYQGAELFSEDLW